MSERSIRSIVKAFTWRFLATLTTMVLVFVFTGRYELALGVGALEITSKLILYYLHERAWDRVSWKRG